MGKSESRVERGIQDQLKLRYEHIGRFRDNQASLAVESESVIVRQTQCDLRSGEMIRSVGQASSRANALGLESASEIGRFTFTRSAC